MNRTNLTRLCAVLVVATSVAGCGGGDGGGGASTIPSVTLPEVKLTQRGPITVHDAEIVFTGYGQRYYPDVVGQIGNLRFDVDSRSIASDFYDNGLLITQAGVVTVTAEDSKDGYETAKDSFTLTIKKGENRELLVDSVYLTTIGHGAQKRPSIRGKKGTTKVMVVAGYEDLISVDYFGTIKAKGRPGQAKVSVTDSGNDRYAPKTVEVPVTITAVEPGTLEFADLKRTYSPTLTLQAYKQSLEETQSVRYVLSADSPDDVIAINEHTGFITVKKAGVVSVDATATYPAGFSKSSETASFSVTIDRARNPAFLASGSDSTDFEPEKVFSPRLSGANLTGIQYSVPDGQNVLEIDKDSKLPKVLNAGKTKINLSIPAGDRYEAWSGSIDFSVNQAYHSGLTIPTAYLTYSPDLVYQVRPIEQKGKLTANSSNYAQWNEASSAFRLTRAGQHNLRVKDDGGNNYRSISKSFNVHVAKAQPVPLRELASLNEVFKTNLVIDLSQKLPKFDRDLELVSIADQSVATVYGGMRVLIRKAGETNISVKMKGDENYFSSEPRSFKLFVTSGSSRLSITSGATSAEAIWKPGGGGSIAPLAITGTKGTLSYKIADGYPTDVVSLDKSSGYMTMRKTGKTRVTVTDSGTAGFSSSDISYDVIVLKAKLKMSASYADHSYEANAKLTPVEEIELMGLNPEPVTTHYELPAQYSDIVTLVNSATGELAIKKAGKFSLNVTATSDNFDSQKFIASGIINKAKHPEIVVGDNVVHYNPRKIFKFNVTSQAIGHRRFVQDLGQTAPVVLTNELTGEFETIRYAEQGMNNYDSSLQVHEAESDNYLAGSKGFTVSVSAPLAAEADMSQEVTFTQSDEKVFVSSELGSQASNLEDSRIDFKGARFVAPTDADIKKYGPGTRIAVGMRWEGDESAVSAQYRIAMFYVTRNDGCGDAPAAIKLDADGVCSNGPTTRSITFHNLTENDRFESGGHWKSIRPVSLMRYGARKFIQTPDGGMYRDATKASKFYEWAVLDFDIDK